MRRLLFFLSICFGVASLQAQVSPLSPDPNPPAQIAGYKLVWSDEFNQTGKPDTANWRYELGFERNQELQWYQPDNANCHDGALHIVGKRERIKNPNYSASTNDWRRNREYAEYTASSIKTQGKQSWQFGRFVIRAKIPAFPGSWPAIWTLGVAQSWPSDIISDGIDGFLVDNGNVIQLAEKICLLIENESLRHTMGKNARENVKRYSAEIIMKKWIDLFESLLIKNHQ